MQTHVHVVWILLPQAAKQQSELRKPHPVSEQRQGRWTLTPEPAASRQGAGARLPAHPDPSSSSSQRPSSPDTWWLKTRWHSSEDRGLGTVVSQFRHLRPEKSSYWYFPPERKLGCPYITGLERKSRAPMKPGLSPWTTHCVHRSF